MDMTSLYIIFGLAMVVNAGVLYLTLGLALAEFKGIYLPFIDLGDKDVRKDRSRRMPRVVPSDRLDFDGKNIRDAFTGHVRRSDLRGDFQ
jgi:hypothetical protein